MPRDGQTSAYLTPRQIAEMLGVGVDRVVGWIRRGELAAVCVSSSLRCRKKQFRVRRESLERFEALRTGNKSVRKTRRNSDFPVYV